MDKQTSHQKPLSVALVGLGQKSKLLFSALLESSSFQLDYLLVNEPRELSERDIELLSQSENLSIQTLSTIESLLKHQCLQAVFLASQANIHTDIIRLCAKYHMPVLCDKYIGANVYDLKALHHELKNKQAQAMVLLPYRFDPALIALKEKLLSGDIGTPHIIKITNRLPKPKSHQTSEQLQRFKQINRHDIDMLSYLANEKISKLSLSNQLTINERLQQQYDLHCPLLSLQLKNGITAIIDYTDKPQDEFDQRIEVFGDGGMLRCDNLSETRLQMISSKPEVHALPYWQFVERYRQSYRNALEAFHHYISNSAQPSPSSIHELLQSIEIQQLIEKAHLEKTLSNSETTS